MSYRVRDWIYQTPASARITHDPRPTRDVFDPIRAELIGRYPEVFARAAEILAGRFITCAQCGREFEREAKQGTRRKFCRAECRNRHNDRRYAA